MPKPNKNFLRGNERQRLWNLEQMPEDITKIIMSTIFACRAPFFRPHFERSKSSLIFLFSCFARCLRAPDQDKIFDL